MGPKNPLQIKGPFEPHDDDPLEGLADAMPTDAELADALAECMAGAERLRVLLPGLALLLLAGGAAALAHRLPPPSALVTPPIAVGSPAGF